MMKKIYISIDVEPDLHTNKYNSIKALPKFLLLLKKYDAKATFFTTCDCLMKYPVIFKKIKLEGHEISLHGYRHIRFDNLSLEEKKEHIKKSLECFNKYLNLKPKGFRAPQHAINNETINLLKKNDFKYDSSISPWNFYHIIFFWKIYVKPSHNFTSMRVHKINGLLEIPLSSFILPFSSLTLRIMPKFLLSLYLSMISFFKNPIFLMHSWDLIENPESRAYVLCPLKNFLVKFEHMLKFFYKKRKFSKIQEIIESNQG